MNEQITDLNETMVRSKRSNNKTMIAILFVAVLPIFSAYFMYFTGIGVPENTVNSGVILPTAVNVNELLSEEEKKQIFDKKKWRLLIPMGETCDNFCQQNLYLTRQVHIRLGEKGIRVERIAAILGGENGKKAFSRLSDQHPKLKSFVADKNTWSTWLNKSNPSFSVLPLEYYLLVDQEGKAMMSYTNQQSGNDLLKDIKRALKFSIDYQ